MARQVGGRQSRLDTSADDLSSRLPSTLVYTGSCGRQWARGDDNVGRLAAAHHPGRGDPLSADFGARDDDKGGKLSADDGSTAGVWRVRVLLRGRTHSSSLCWCQCDRRPTRPTTKHDASVSITTVPGNLNLVWD